jgi:1-aminocyclopropane-1-carboxylate deaminase/D-cysteine desulfhydrase-like pyridoxal-dependent ACC family enzyme
VDESIEGTKKEAVECVNKYATVVVAVGSGTIAAGIVRAGVPRIKVVGVMCRTGNKEKKKREIINRARELGCPLAQLELVDPGYQYTEAAHIKCPFPSHPFYDKKAFKWMVENIEKLENPVLFWNIGSMNRRMTI